MVADVRWLTPGTGVAQVASAGSSAVYRYSAAGLAVALLGPALLCIALSPALRWLWQTWMERPEYSHGPMLPVIAGYLAWQSRTKLEKIPFGGDWRGTLLVAVAAALVLVGGLGAVYTLQQYALVLGLAGLLLALTNIAVVRLQLAPLALLVLMVPAPNFLLNNLSAELQLISSSLGVAFIRAAGISVYLSGNVVDLGGYRLQVVEACDGMRYLFPLMTIGLLIGYLYKGAFWKRAVVFLSSIPITILMNSLRVGTIGVLVDRWGPRMAEGFLHEFQGWMVFMLSAALLIALTMALNRIGPETLPWRERFGLELPARTPRGVAAIRRQVPRPYIVALLLVAAASGTGYIVPPQSESVPARHSFMTFPMQLGEMSGRRQSLEGPVLDVLQVDDYLLADYASRGTPGVNLYASYYSSQRDRRVVHSPRACIPGGGWRIERSSQVAIEGTGLMANRMVITNGSERQLVYYWFDQRGRNLTSELAVKWFLFWDALTRRRTDGAMVRVLTAIQRDEPERVAEIRLLAVARSVAPLLPTYIPH